MLEAKTDSYKQGKADGLAEGIQSMADKVVLDYFSKDEVLKMLYKIDVDKVPTIQDEAWANQYESKAQAFWYGQAQYRKEIVEALTKDQ